MKKATLILGLAYILYAFWLFLSIVRLSSFYHEFGAGLPSTSLFLPFAVLGYGLTQAIAYFINFKNKKICTGLFMLGLVFIVVWISYVLIAGFIANREINRVLEDAMQ